MFFPIFWLQMPKRKKYLLNISFTTIQDILEHPTLYWPGLALCWQWPPLYWPDLALCWPRPVLVRPSSVLALYWPDPALEKLKRMLPKLVYWSNLPQRNPIQSTSNLELCNSRDGKDMICNYLMLLYQKNIRYYMFNMSYPFFYRTLLTVYFLKNYKNT